MTVTCVDDNPVAVDDARPWPRTPPRPPIDVLANDTDPDGGPKTIASATQPANGTVVTHRRHAGAHRPDLRSPTPNYCNNPGTTPDTFTYTLTPGGSTATVIDDRDLRRRRPGRGQRRRDGGRGRRGDRGHVLANDTDIDGGPKTIASATQPANGAVVLTGGSAGAPRG